MHKKNNQLLIYQLIELSLSLMLFAWLVFLLAENILPGIISNYFSISALVFFSLLIFILLGYLGRKINITKQNKKGDIFTIIFLLLFNALVLPLALWKFPSPALILIALFTLLCLSKVAFNYLKSK